MRHPRRGIGRRRQHERHAATPASGTLRSITSKGLNRRHHERTGQAVRRDPECLRRHRFLRGWPEATNFLAHPHRFVLLGSQCYSPASRHQRHGRALRWPLPLGRRRRCLVTAAGEPDPLHRPLFAATRRDADLIGHQEARQREAEIVASSLCVRITI